eukprot:364964-Chlamydomonas_euryale.AAC.12
MRRAWIGTASAAGWFLLPLFGEACECAPEVSRRSEQHPHSCTHMHAGGIAQDVTGAAAGGHVSPIPVASPCDRQVPAGAHAVPPFATWYTDISIALLLNARS